jgi:hypothetical protein
VCVGGGARHNVLTLVCLAYIQVRWGGLCVCVVEGLGCAVGVVCPYCGWDSRGETAGCCCVMHVQGRTLVALKPLTLLWDQNSTGQDRVHCSANRLHAAFLCAAVCRA